jgi:hypothetical protein
MPVAWVSPSTTLPSAGRDPHGPPFNVHATSTVRSGPRTAVASATASFAGPRLTVAVQAGGVGKLMLDV